MASNPQPPTEPTSKDVAMTAMVHLYRGEMHRMSVWRQRLDVTSNWAIILATALTTFTLGSAEVPHYTLLLGLALVLISILLEGRRYRHLHHSKWRLYLLESGFFANLLQPATGTDPCPDWERLLAADLRHTHYSISWLTSMRLRLRRNYLLVIGFMAAVWVAKLFIHPAKATTVAEFYSRLHVGEFIPSWMVATTAFIFLVAAAVLGLTCPPAEELEDWSIDYHRRRAQNAVDGTRPPAGASRQATDSKSESW